MISPSELLKEKDISFVEKGKDLLISCISPEHIETNPSCRVDQETGAFHCFSCGYKGNIYTEFNEEANYIIQTSVKLRNKIKDLLQETASIEIPLESTPFNEDYRDIKASTYKKFNAFYYNSRVCIPISDVSGRTIAYIGREKFSEYNHKYEVVPTRAKLPIFPHLANRLTHILVEGPFDMLNLHDKGLENSSCIFGANNSNNIDEKLITLQVQGVKRIAIMLDGDEAGVSAALKLERQIKYKTKFDTVIIPLPTGSDPGSLSQKDVLEIKAQYKL